MKKYILFEPDEEYTFDPKENSLQLACCDCNLVHLMRFWVNDNGTLTFTLEVNEEETNRLRDNPEIKESVMKKHKEA